MIAKHLISIMVQKRVNGVVKWVSRLLVCTRRSVYLKTDLAFRDVRVLGHGIHEIKENGKIHSVTTNY